MHFQGSLWIAKCLLETSFFWNHSTNKMYSFVSSSFPYWAHVCKLNVGLLCITVCLSVCLGLLELCCAPPREYRTTLCTTELHCVLSSCIVHHGAQGGPMSGRSGGRPRHFPFFDGAQGICKKLTLFVCGAEARTYTNMVFLWLTTNKQIKVHNVVLHRRTLWHNAALYQLGCAQDNFACSLSTFFYGV